MYFCVCWLWYYSLYLALFSSTIISNCRIRWKLSFCYLSLQQKFWVKYMPIIFCFLLGYHAAYIKRILAAAIGFSMVDILNRNERFSFALSPTFMAIVAFCFSMTIGVMWEFFEFAMDWFFLLGYAKRIPLLLPYLLLCWIPQAAIHQHRLKISQML